MRELMEKPRILIIEDNADTRKFLEAMLSKEFEVITNIRRADVQADKGWVILELEGDETAIAAGIAWVMERGVRVDPVLGDVVEG